MKKVISLFLTLCLLFSFNVYAETNLEYQDLIYEIIKGEQESYAVITGISEGSTNETLVIPSVIDGYEVREIGDYAFSGSKIKKAILPEGIKKIGYFAFSNCTELESIEFTNTIEEFGGSAFSFCTKLTDFRCPDSLKKIGTNAFSYCTNLQNLYLNEGLEEIEGLAIANCDKLAKIVIPSTVQTISYGGLLPIIEYCNALETIELKCKLENPQIFVADCPNLKEIVFYEDIGDFDYNGTFKYSFYACKPRVKMVNPREYTTPLDVTIKAKKGTNIEKFAVENGFDFIALENEQNTTFESKYDISKFMDSSIYKIRNVFDTEYGAVVYYSVGGVMKAPGPSLSLVKENGESLYLSQNISTETLWRNPEHNDIALSEDGKYVTFNVSFDSRETAHTMGSGEFIVLHDAGTYYYKSDLETGVTIETRFEPKDTLGEDVISSWAKPEVEKAIELCFVPISFRENYTRNITRGEFAKLAMFFLQMQYGYQGVSAVQVWSPTGYSDNTFFKPQFMNAYCATHTDRNGNPFRDKYETEDYKYHNTNVEIKLPEMPFDDVDEYSKDFDFIERAYHIGIVNGLSETVFNPEGDITRQEAAAMLMRVYKNYAKVENTDNAYLFADDEAIADWAKEDVYAINSLGVMQGIGDDMFAPLDNYTIEQAIATFLRLYESAPVSRKNKNITPLLDYQYESKQYFHREGGSYFHETERKEYENFIMVGGYWTQRHTTSTTDRSYIFRKTGGMIDISQVWEISPDEKTISTVSSIGDTFRLYNKLNGTEKVYSKGEYKMKIDLDTGILIEFEKVA